MWIRAATHWTEWESTIHFRTHLWNKIAIIYHVFYVYSIYFILIFIIFILAVLVKLMCNNAKNAIEISFNECNNAPCSVAILAYFLPHSKCELQTKKSMQNRTNNSLKQENVILSAHNRT